MVLYCWDKGIRGFKWAIFYVFPKGNQREYYGMKGYAKSNINRNIIGFGVRIGYHTGKKDKH